jgi:hypothetical protein
VLLGLLFAGFIVAELDLYRHVFGRSVVVTKVLVDQRVPLPLRLLTALALLSLAAAGLAYAWRRRADLIGAARALVRAPSGRLLLVGLTLMLCVQLFERPLDRLFLLPRYFLEESLELLAGLYCLLAVAARPLRATLGRLP